MAVFESGVLKGRANNCRQKYVDTSHMTLRTSHSSPPAAIERAAPHAIISERSASLSPINAPPIPVPVSFSSGKPPHCQGAVQLSPRAESCDGVYRNRSSTPLDPYCTFRAGRFEFSVSLEPTQASCWIWVTSRINTRWDPLMVVVGLTLLLSEFLDFTPITSISALI